jgi:hypothetical protein
MSMLKTEQTTRTTSSEKEQDTGTSIRRASSSHQVTTTGVTVP